MNRVPFVVTGFRRREEAEAYAATRPYAEVLDNPLRVVETEGVKAATAPSPASTDTLLLEFCHGQIKFLRDFAADHPTMTFGELLLVCTAIWNELTRVGTNIITFTKDS